MQSITNSDPLLSNLQANILKGHGRNFACHLFFSLQFEQAGAARQWISSFAASPNGITSAAQQLKTTRDRKQELITDGGTIITLSLSSSGYDKLGIAAARPAEASFVAGMQANASFLGDNLEQWELPFLQSVDLLIIVADDQRSKANATADQIALEVSTFGALLLKQEGNVLKTQDNVGIEHFGYADGISQPLFLTEDINEQKCVAEWNDASDPDLVLVDDGAGQHCFGSYLVFRKLEQNVKAFKEAEKNLPTVLDRRGENVQLAGAMLVGRFENGLPVATFSRGDTTPPLITNDFSYHDDMDATKCPFHAHIRLMNPRRGDRQAGNQDQHRITRRGIPYDEVGRIPEERITSISDDLLNDTEPSAGVGLLFMCYQKNISNQFEILQGFWANKGQIGPHKVKGEDSLISQGSNPEKSLPKKWGEAAQSDPFSFKNFVTTRGGEYFFTPSIPFLKALAVEVPPTAG